MNVMSSLFQDNWADVTGAGEVSANINTTKWPNPVVYAANAGLAANKDAFFDAVNNILIQVQSGDVRIGPSQAVTYNQNKEHSLNLASTTWKNVANSQVGFAEIYGEVSAAFASYWAVKLSSFGSGLTAALIKTGTVMASNNALPINLNTPSTLTLDFGQWNGTSRVITVSWAGTQYISFTDTSGPLANSNMVALDLYSPGSTTSLATDENLTVGTLTLKGFVM